MRHKTGFSFLALKHLILQWDDGKANQKFTCMKIKEIMFTKLYSFLTSAQKYFFYNLWSQYVEYQEWKKLYRLINMSSKVFPKFCFWILKNPNDVSKNKKFSKAIHLFFYSEIQRSETIFLWPICMQTFFSIIF